MALVEVPESKLASLHEVLLAEVVRWLSSPLDVARLDCISRLFHLGTPRSEVWSVSIRFTPVWRCGGVVRVAVFVSRVGLRWYGPTVTCQRCCFMISNTHDTVSPTVSFMM